MSAGGKTAPAPVVLDEDDFSRGVKRGSSHPTIPELWQKIGPFVLAVLFGVDFEISRAVPAVAAVALLIRGRYRRIALALNTQKQLEGQWPEMAFQFRQGLAMVDTNGPGRRGVAWWLCQVAAGNGEDPVVGAAGLLVGPLQALGLALGALWQEVIDEELRTGELWRQVLAGEVGRGETQFATMAPSELRDLVGRMMAARLVIGIADGKRMDSLPAEAAEAASIGGLCELIGEPMPALRETDAERAIQLREVLWKMSGFIAIGRVMS